MSNRLISVMKSVKSRNYLPFVLTVNVHLVSLILYLYEFKLHIISFVSTRLDNKIPPEHFRTLCEDYFFVFTHFSEVESTQIGFFVQSICFLFRLIYYLSYRIVSGTSKKPV